MGDLLKESAIVFFISTILLVSGCVSHTAISSPPTTSEVVTNQPAADFSHQYPPDPSHWIEIDPIRNFTIGSGSGSDRIVFNITGTTNLPVNSLLFIEPYRTDLSSGKEEKALLWNVVVPVEDKGVDTNTFFYAANVTTDVVVRQQYGGSPIKPGDYRVVVRRESVSNSTGFTILGKDPLPFIWIRINPLGEHYHGDIFNITGSTNLPAGSEIIVKAERHYPAYLYPSCSVKDSDVIHLRDCVNSVEHFEKRVRIDKANGGDNTWISSVDTTGWCECYSYRFEAIKEGWDNISSANEEFGFHYK